MTQSRDIERLLDRWFANGTSVAPDRVVDIVADRIERQPQRPAWRLDQRYLHVTAPAKTLMAAAAVLVVAIIGFNLASGFSAPPFGDQHTPPPSTPVVSPSPTSSPAAQSSPDASQGPTAKLAVSPLKASGLLVFVHGTPGIGPRIEFLAPDLRGQELLPNIRGSQKTPSWSADGKHLAFAASNPNDPSPRQLLYETDAAGTQPKQLSTACEPPACMEESDPAYSADGTHLAFIRWIGPSVDGETGSVVAVRDFATGSVVELDATRSTLPAKEASHPSWSPDGTRLTYHVITWGADGRATDSVIYTIAADGTGKKRLSPTDIKAGDAAWSPDGSRILFSSDPIHSFWANGGGTDLTKLHIYTIARDGSDLRQIDGSGNAGAPSWAAAGQQILYTQITDNAGLGAPWVMVMGSDGSGNARVARYGDCCRWYAVQQPTP